MELLSLADLIALIARLVARRDRLPALAEQKILVPLPDVDPVPILSLTHTIEVASSKPHASRTWMMKEGGAPQKQHGVRRRPRGCPASRAYVFTLTRGRVSTGCRAAKGSEQDTLDR